jgi:hypothetical protein
MEVEGFVRRGPMQIDSRAVDSDLRDQCRDEKSDKK